MTQFTGDIAGILEIFAIAAGLVVLHYGKKEAATLLKAAGIILLAGGILSGICTSYYWFKYHSAGIFDKSAHTCPMKYHGSMMNSEQMQRMHQNMMKKDSSNRMPMK